MYNSCGGANEDGHLNHANDVKQRSTIQFILETAAGAGLIAAASGDAPKLTSMAPAHSHNSTPLLTRVHALPHAEVNKLTKRFQGCTAAEQTVDKSGVAYATITIVKPNVRQTQLLAALMRWCGLAPHTRDVYYHFLDWRRQRAQILPEREPALHGAHQTGDTKMSLVSHGCMAGGTLGPALLAPPPFIVLSCALPFDMLPSIEPLMDLDS